MSRQQVNLEVSYGEQEAMLYALAIGLGRDPLDHAELPYVYERPALKILPTFASILPPAGFLQDCGWNYDQVLHGEQKLQLYRPLPQRARLLINRRVVDVFDKGKKGAIICIETEGRLASNDNALFTLASTIVARADGGCGGASGSAPKPHSLPRRAADMFCELQTRKDQALIYRLCGDRNPLHADPLFAEKQGFPVPILHGLCTYGIACHAILKTICDYDFTLVTAFDVRFTAPVYPGDTVKTEMWQDGNVVSFRCTVPERAVTVLDNGRCVIAG